MSKVFVPGLKYRNKGTKMVYLCTEIDIGKRLGETIDSAYLVAYTEDGEQIAETTARINELAWEEAEK